MDYMKEKAAIKKKFAAMSEIKLYGILRHVYYSSEPTWNHKVMVETMIRAWKFGKLPKTI